MESSLIAIALIFTQGMFASIEEAQGPCSPLYSAKVGPNKPHCAYLHSYLEVLLVLTYPEITEKCPLSFLDMNI